MTQPTFFIRALLIIMSILLMIAFTFHAEIPQNYFMGILFALVISLSIIGLERLFKRLSFRLFNITLVGLGAGYLMGILLLHIFATLAEIALLNETIPVISFCKLFLFLFGLYLGVILSYRHADEFSLSLPFIKFQSQETQKTYLPLKQQGEPLSVKIQRLGKEELQGVGYLEDGTMVVVNGGGEFIGEMVEARVLSTKQTQSGRLIFCNLSEE